MNATPQFAASSMAIGRLHIAPENPRSDETIDDAKIDVLAENIKEVGVIQPLIGYVHDGQGLVVAGGRRLRALRRLVEQGALDEETEVPFREIAFDEAEIIGIAEQLSHEAMSPLDELRTYDLPRFRKLTNTQLSHIMGKSIKAVEQRRAVLTLPEPVLARVFDGRISVDQGFGLTYFMDDAVAMAEAVERCEGDRRFGLNELRRSFMRKREEWQDCPASKIVTQEEYIEAGGQLQTDLFTEAAFVLSPDILDGLADDAARTRIMFDYPEAAFIRRADGIWDVPRHRGIKTMTEDQYDEWFELSSMEDEDMTTEQSARLAELEPLSEASYPDELKALLGVVYTMRQRGDVPYVYADRALPDDLEPLYEAGYLTRPEEAGSGTSGEGEAEPQTGLTAKQKDRIARVLTHCRRMEMAKRPDAVMLAYLKYVRSARAWPWPFTDTPQPANGIEGLEDMLTVSPAWGKMEEFSDLSGDALDDMKPADTRLCIARHILDCMTLQAEGPHIDVTILRKYFRPTVDFFKGYRRGDLLHMIGEAQPEVEVGEYASLKKTALEELATHLYNANPGWTPTGF